MSKIVWDQTGSRTYETGIDHGVLYPLDTNAQYSKGVAWNGLVSASESPSGAESNPQYADNIKYLNLVSAEDFGLTLEAFTYPDEFALCDGSAEPVPGLTLGQQARKTFGLSYRTILGNDVAGDGYGYKLHLVYGCLASPSEKGYQTVNDSPEAITFSWEITTTPVALTEVDPVTNKAYRPTAVLILDSTKLGADKMAAIETVLYGTDAVDGGDPGTEGRLPLPDEVIQILKTAG